MDIDTHLSKVDRGYSLRDRVTVDSLNQAYISEETSRKLLAVISECVHLVSRPGSESVPVASILDDESFKGCQVKFSPHEHSLDLEFYRPDDSQPGLVITTYNSRAVQLGRSLVGLGNIAMARI